MASRSPLRILITNNTAASRAGSELYVRDLALQLLARGHQPVVYSTILGEVADLLHRATIPVVDDLDALAFVPDIIHGQHHLEAMTAILRFPGVPAVYFCHGWLPWEEQPPVHPSIRRHVAVDDLCADRLLTTAGIDAARIDTIYNGVDLARFKPRPVLPPKPRAALIFSNYAGWEGYAGAIRAACQRVGIDRVDIAGLSAGVVAREPEQLLAEYDIVFAKARCALEAMATGCATIVADAAGLAGMVSMDNIERLRRLNFGVRTMQAGAVTEEAIAIELDRYDPASAGRVSTWIRENASFKASVDLILESYRKALADSPGADAMADARATASYLRTLSARLKTVHVAEHKAWASMEAETQLRAELEQHAGRDVALQAEVEQRSYVTAAQASEAQAREAEARAMVSDALAREAREAATCLQQQLDAATTARAQLKACSGELEQRIAELQQQVENANEALSVIHGSRSWRLLTVYRRMRARLP